MSRLGRSVTSANAKTELELALGELYHFVSTTLPSAMRETYWCEDSIKEAVEQALHCQYCVANLPKDLLAKQFALFLEEQPNYSSSCRLELTPSFFHTSLEQLYMNFAQNPLLLPYTLEKLNSVVKAAVGPDTLKSYQEKAQLFFNQYDEICNFLKMCPPKTGKEVQARLVEERVKPVQDQNCKIM